MYVLLKVDLLFGWKCIFYLSFVNCFLLWSCSEALSLTKPLTEGLSTDWSWSGCGLKRFALQWWDSWELQVRCDCIAKPIQKPLIKIWLISGKPRELWVIILWHCSLITHWSKDEVIDLGHIVQDSLLCQDQGEWKNSRLSVCKNKSTSLQQARKGLEQMRSGPGVQDTHPDTREMHCKRLLLQEHSGFCSELKTLQ